MELVGVRVEVPANTPVVVLREEEGRQRLLPILIGSAEASAIHAAVEGIVPPRPLTHDLLVDVLATVHTEVTKVVITEVREHTYFAELHLRTGGTEVTVSSRPSDAIAIAVRVGCPIFADPDLLDQVAIDGGTSEIGEQEEDAILDEFREFLDDINPDDFSA
jgi:uncharacterized protein